MFTQPEAGNIGEVEPDVSRASRWNGPSGCTTTVTELKVIAAAASELHGAVRGRLADPATVLHELVAWAYVYDRDASHALLVHHPRHRLWMPPGGRVDAGESPLEAAVRELREETGAAVSARPDERAALVDVVDHPLADGTPASTFGVAYAFVVDATAPLLTEKDQPAGWWPLVSPPAPLAERHWIRLQRHRPGR